MLGILVTGHGKFSEGLLHSLEMIAGKKNNVKNVVFEENMNLEVYTETINQSIKYFQETYDGVVVLTDLKGGTPFNVSLMESQSLSPVEVLAGANLPMLIEGTMKSEFYDSVEKLAKELVITGKTGVERGVIDSKDDETVIEEDGI